MSTTANEVWLTADGFRQRLDLDDETQLLPTFQANDRSKPDTIQADYSPEFSVPGTARNHRLLRHAASAQPAPGAAYVRLPCVLTSGGVETLPLALLYIKGYREGRILLQLAGGNRRLIEALGEKTLQQLDFSRFDHIWNPANVAAGLPYAHWAQLGWGYEVYERGKPVDALALNSYDLYPSVAASLIWDQILTQAGFTADSLLDEPLFAALTVPAANPFSFSQAFRDARQLTAGFSYYVPPGQNPTVTPYAAGYVGLGHTAGFDWEQLRFAFTDLSPFHAPTAGAHYDAATGEYVVDTFGYYTLGARVLADFGCRESVFSGHVTLRVAVWVNGVLVFNQSGEQGNWYYRTDKYEQHLFTPELTKYLLHPGDRISLRWRGEEQNGPIDPYWQIGPAGTHTVLASGLYVANEAQFLVTLLPDFPPGGLVELAQWLPEMKQLDFLKSMMLLLGLTIQVDAYRPHLHLGAGNKLLQNIPFAKDWTAKRDAYAVPGRVPERDLTYRFGEYAKRNGLLWAEDEHVPAGYGNGLISVADEALAPAYTLATLPFAASQTSPLVSGLLRILNFEAGDLTQTPPTYTLVQAKPRLALRAADSLLSGMLILEPAHSAGAPVAGQAGQTYSTSAPAVLAPISYSASYFAGVDLSLLLNGTVLTTYWADLRAMLQESRYLRERYRLTPQDIAELDFSIPIYDAGLGDYFAVSAVSEYDARRAVEVHLVRLNADHLPEPLPGGAGLEFADSEFNAAEYY